MITQRNENKRLEDFPLLSHYAIFGEKNEGSRSVERKIPVESTKLLALRRTISEAKTAT